MGELRAEGTGCWVKRKKTATGVNNRGLIKLKSTNPGHNIHTRVPRIPPLAGWWATCRAACHSQQTIIPCHLHDNGEPSITHTLTISIIYLLYIYIEMEMFGCTLFTPAFVSFFPQQNNQNHYYFFCFHSDDFSFY